MRKYCAVEVLYPETWRCGGEGVRGMVRGVGMGVERKVRDITIGFYSPVCCVGHIRERESAKTG